MIMKTLIAILTLAASAFVSKAQTTTNIAIRFTVETVTAGVTNSTPTNFRWDYGNKKEALRVDGLNFAYSHYVSTFGTNAPTLNFNQWMKANYTDFVQGYASQKQQADNVIILQKLTVLLNGNTDLLTQSDLNNLATIAAKAP